MKIKLMSDIHSEFWREPEFRQNFRGDFADVLVLAGDIAVGLEKTADLLNWFSDQYEHVVYVPGNHEYYNHSINELDDLNCSLHINVHTLDQDIVTIHDVTFIGASLWTNFREDFMAMHMAKDMIADFRLIKKFKPQDAKNMFNDDMDFIKQCYETTQGKKVVVTHFLPAVECIHPRFQNGSLLNNYFANDLSGWISNLTDTTWMFGHTHDSVDITIGETRLVCNPYGYQYVETNPNFNKNFSIEV